MVLVNLVSGQSFRFVFEIADQAENTLQNNPNDLYPACDQKI